MQKIVTLCDIDANEDDVQTYTILVNGKGVDIDLCTRDAADLMAAVEVYMRVGRSPEGISTVRVPKRRRSPKDAATTTQAPAYVAPYITLNAAGRRVVHGTFPCDQCDRMFDTSQGVSMHRMRAHNHQGGTAGVKITRATKRIPESTEPTPVVPAPVLFGGAQGMAGPSHRRRKSKKQHAVVRLPHPVSCPICGKTGYTTVPGLSSHLRQAHNTPDSGSAAMRIAADAEAALVGVS